MKKEQIELCREVVKILDKASFTFSGPEMVQVSIKLMNFGKMIQDAEKLLNAPLVPVPTVEEPITPPVTTRRRR